MRRTVRLLTALIVFTCGAASMAAEISLEYAVKANFLYKFGAYITWPDNATGAPEDAMKLCIVGADPFGAALDEAAKGEKIGTHPIAIVRLATLAPDSGCHILFIQGAKRDEIAAALKAVAGKPILTITETPGETIDGNTDIINFVLKDNSVRFVIDEHAAAASAIEISSKLLNLAVAVRPRS